LNLSLRDIEELVSCIDQGLEKDLRINEFSILQKYVTKRDYDQNQVINFTHSLVETFSSSSFFKAFPTKVRALNAGFISSVKTGACDESFWEKIRIRQLTTVIPSQSAINAGFSSPSISTTTLCLSKK
jgi:hypothetical protein